MTARSDYVCGEIGAVTLDAHKRLILVGFYLLFMGGAGAMVASTTELFPEYASLAVKFLLLPAAGVGGLLIAIAKLNRLEGE
jgi:hypothetical protein